MTVFAVQYTYDERTALRDQVRPEHRAFLRGQADIGLLLGSGPWAEGPAGALLVFRTATREALDAILVADPFARVGVITATEVRVWDVVLGPWADSVR